MTDATQPVQIDYYIKLTAQFGPEGLTLTEEYPEIYDDERRKLAFMLLVQKLIEEKYERLSARNTP